MQAHEAYERILRQAQTIANHDPRKPHYLGGDTFTLPNKFDRLELWYDVYTVTNGVKEAQLRRGELRSEEQIIDLFTTIVQDAVHKAIRMEREALTSLLMENIRNNAAAS